MAPSPLAVLAALALLVIATPCTAHSENGTFWLVAENTQSPGARSADYLTLPAVANATRIGDYTAFSQNVYAINKTLGDFTPRSREFYGHLTGVSTVVNGPTANTTTLFQAQLTIVFREGHYAGSTIVLSGVYYTSDLTRRYSIIGGSDDFKYVRGEATVNSTVINGLPGAGNEYYLYVNYDVKH
ncbi:hypothetical protein KFL_004880020 [Klebsormidium nitens]|uniref:Dirigent protein n=1 Tax=Klebsormidium nitens TaxID=105231 RepID=A0A1Y1IKA9_KLENI|nr:hypothetical protein KFL_004880020 [Klebsormidium nitens]|eukprot:GAQ89107.1 hypothetical protein KFL_004880020 [Klebsormidium nitens]